MTSSQQGDANSGTRPVVGRFAPSPSGRMHLGNALSALVAWLGVRSENGRLILRIEDLDPARSSMRAAEDIMDDLRWLGLDWDEGPYYQSERLDLYEKAARLLTEAELTYPCFCTRAELHAASAPHASDGTYVYGGTCAHLSPEEVLRRSQRRPGALRLRVPPLDDPHGTIAFEDLVFGPQREVLAQDCGDFLIRRSDGVFAYQLAVVVDDGLMGITQITRGRDLLGSCARQIYLLRLLGFDAPAFAHVPLLVSDNGRRLSKRDRDLDLGAIREAGTSPEQVISRLACALGLADDGEVLRAEDLIERFSWKAIARIAAAGDIRIRR